MCLEINASFSALCQNLFFSDNENGAYNNSLWRVGETICVNTQKAGQIKQFSYCERAQPCCPALVHLDPLFFRNGENQRALPETTVSWLGFCIKFHSVFRHGIELTCKAARERDNFLWDSMCWDKVPVRIPFPKGRAKPVHRLPHQKMSGATHRPPLGRSSRQPSWVPGVLEAPGQTPRSGRKWPWCVWLW